MQELLQDCFAFLDAGVSPYHATAQAAARLEAAGFLHLEESADWAMVPGGCYYTTRNASSLIAWRLPRRTLGGWRGAAAHSDSPTFHLTKTKTADALYAKARVEGYGGMRLSTWLDRPLTVAGRVLVQTQSGIESRLVAPDCALLCIPSVCVHFDREGAKGHALNPAVDLQPIYGGPEATLDTVLAQAAGCAPADILDSDLVLAVRQRAVALGPAQELFLSPRIDDLGAAYATLAGFLAGHGSDSRGDVWCLFDNEEVGSGTRQGALGSFLADVLARAEAALAVTPGGHVRAQANSLLLSADNAHATHPNHPELSDAAHPIRLNGGVVVKYSANQKYTTSGLTGALFGAVCRRAGVPVQPFYNRPDVPGGSTLGNLLARQVSLPMVDIGLGQLSMHAAVETAGTADVGYMASAVGAFYNTVFAQPQDGCWQLEG